MTVPSATCNSSIVWKESSPGLVEPTLDSHTWISPFVLTSWNFDKSGQKSGNVSITSLLQTDEE